MRLFYIGLIWLHPRYFRQRFGDEMLSIYDQAAADHADLIPLVLTRAYRSHGNGCCVRTLSSSAPRPVPHPMDYRSSLPKTPTFPKLPR
jgi:hypothetical protein